MSFTKTIDVPEALRLLNRVVERFGRDHTATAPEGSTSACIYATLVNGVLVPVCIVGQVIADHGFLGALMHADPTDPNYSLNSEVSQEGTCDTGYALWTSLETVGLKFTHEAQAFMRDAQYAQDNRIPWGPAVDYAVDRYLAGQANEAAQSLGVYRPRKSIGIEDYRPAEPEVTPEQPEDGLADWERELLEG